MNDNINPDYYRKGIETTDYIQSHSMNYLEGNIIKYVTRHRFQRRLSQLLHQPLQRPHVYFQKRT